MSQSTKRELQVQAVLISFVVMGLTAIVMLSGDRMQPALADELDTINTACCDDMCEESGLRSWTLVTAMFGMNFQEFFSTIHPHPSSRSLDLDGTAKCTSIQLGK